MTAIVDIHCHNFNGDDLPVKGFIRSVGGTKTSLVKLIDGIVDKYVQGHAPGFEEELEEISKRMDPRTAVLESSFIEADPDAEAAVILAQIEAQDEQLVRDAESELYREEVALAPEDEVVEEGFFDLAGDVKRYIKWALLFAKARIRLTEILAGTFPEVDLYTPLLVDLEQGLGDAPETSVVEQLELQEAISRVSMLGKLWGRPDARVHPFVGFDPRRPGALDTVRAAVVDYGCVGVKVYPPMGFQPIGNAEAPHPKGMSPEDARAADAALRDLYDYCLTEDVPITAHGNPTNFADDEYETFSSPEYWGAVLAEFPGLHLDLGHFGGSGSGKHADWPSRIAKLATRYQHVYADIGNHRLEGIDAYMARLKQLFSDPVTAAMQDRLMFGTDWFMLANHRNFQDFLIEFRQKYADSFPEAHFPGALSRFMGGAALSFLGFDDAMNANSQRVAARYRDLGVSRPDWLTAS